MLFVSTALVLLLSAAIPTPTAATTNVATYQPADTPDKAAAALFAKLEAGVDDEDLEHAQAALEWDFGHAGLLEAAARIAAELDEKDTAFWYGSLAAEAAAANEDKKAQASINELMVSLTPEGADPTALFDAYAEDLFKVAQDCKTKKLYANAADVLMRCRGTRFERRAENLLGSLFKKDDAIDAIFKSGIDLPARPVTKKAPKWIAKYDAKHSDWEDVEDIKKGTYVIQTDMGYEMGQTFAQTMGQMGLFYKDLFQIRKKIKPCTIKIYSTRDAMAANEKEFEEGILGWFQPWNNVVVTFDPRSQNRPFAGLWGTLFHEAAHQFMRSICSARIPGWLSEGTACYFEGADLLPSGAVLTNAIPESRLRSLVYMLDNQPEWDLAGCVRYDKPGSYAGEYYPFGWGLVYYIFNYENDDSERIYIPLFREYQKLYTKEKSHDPYKRFLKFFIERAKVEGVTDFASFNLHWQEWIRELHEIHFGDESQADVLIARADKQQKNKKAEYAIASLRWAVAKRPNDIALRMRFADTLKVGKQEDGATHSYRRAMEMARRYDGETIPGLDMSPEDVTAACIAKISKISKNVGGKLGRADANLVSGTQAAADVFVEAGYPRSSVYLVQMASQLLDGHRGLDAFARTLVRTEGLDIVRTRRMRIEKKLENVVCNHDQFSAVEDNVLVSKPAGAALHSATFRDAPTGPYRLEVTVTPDEYDDLALVGLVIGSNTETGELFCLVSPNSPFAMVMALGDKGLDSLGPLDGSLSNDEGESFQLAVDVDGTSLKFSIDGEEAGELEVESAEKLRGRVGVGLQGCSAKFSNFVLTY